MKIRYYLSLAAALVASAFAAPTTPPTGPVTGSPGSDGTGLSSPSNWRAILGLGTEQTQTWAGIVNTPISGGTGSFTSVTSSIGTFTTLGASGALNVTANGALSAPAMTLAGTWINGGTSTTNKPYMLIEPAGTTSTGWSGNPTGLGINAATSTGEFFRFTVNGVSKAFLSTMAIPNFNLTGTTGGGLNINSSGTISRSGGGALDVTVTPGGAGSVIANGPLTVAGQTQLAASQALTNGQSAVSRDLGDGRYTQTSQTALPLLVTVYGADPTGATDSTAAVTATFTAASTGFRWVHFPRGTYKLNMTLTNALSSGHWKITGDGGGSIGDWAASEAPGATLLKPNNNALPVFRFDFIRGVSIERLEIRGNGAGISSDGILLDNPAGTFAGNGLYCRNVNLRGFTRGLNSVGGCNVHFEDCGLFNNNNAIVIPNLPLAHSYRFEQCCIGGQATVLGGSGESWFADVADGSFLDFAGCEMGNCTGMIKTQATGAPIINIIGGNMETIGPSSGSVLNLIKGGAFNMTGVRIATGDRVVCRADGTTVDITGINIENNSAHGAMTMFDHYAFPYARLSGNGLSKAVKTYSDSTFTTLLGASVCEKLAVSARLTVAQTLPGAATTTLICNVANYNNGSKYNTTTGEFAAGKNTRLQVSATIRLTSLSTNAFLMVYVNGASRGTLGQASSVGGVIMASGTTDISVAPGDIVTIRVNLGAGGADVMTADNYTSIMSIKEIPYFN